MSKVNTKQVIKVLLDHVRPYKWIAMFMLVLIVIANIANVIIPIYYKKLFNIVSGEIVLKGTVMDNLVGILLAVLALECVVWVSSRSSNFLSHWLNPTIQADLSRTAHSDLQKHSYRFFSNSFIGSLVRRVNKLSRCYDQLSIEIEFQFVPVVVSGIGYTIVLYMQHHMLAYILVSWMIIYIVMIVIFAKWKLKYDFKVSKIDSETTGVLGDSLANSTNVKLFTAEKHENKLFYNVTEKLKKIRTFTWSINEVMESVQALFMIFINFFMMYYAIQLWSKGLLTIGDFVLIQAYLVGMFGMMWDVGRAIRRVYESLADANEMVETLNQPYEVTDVRNAKELDIQTGKIEFKEVYFSFRDTRRVLNGLNILINPKEKIALVGPSGAGKSTIIKLLFRFYDVEKGKIIIGNQNIAKVTQKSLRDNIALVPQDPVLFHRTIMENIRYGRIDATNTEVVAAAKKANAHEFIEGLSEGYDTYVGERGIKLSGGEKQRIAIARAILKDAPILVLDEATSSLDSKSEQLIQIALEELMKNKTVIVIAHRMSTVMQMDRIFVIENGKVSSVGTHENLLKEKGNTYKKLWDIQAGGFNKKYQR